MLPLPRGSFPGQPSVQARTPRRLRGRFRRRGRSAAANREEVGERQGGGAHSHRARSELAELDADVRGGMMQGLGEGVRARRLQEARAELQSGPSADDCWTWTLSSGSNGRPEARMMSLAFFICVYDVRRASTIRVTSSAGRSRSR
ncbi:hypothetical protein AAW14_36935 [Streptomyces hygroscopicus]|nr:hypothetical protein [Streptomyces hygroscopicus]